MNGIGITGRRVEVVVFILLVCILGISCLLVFQHINAQRDCLVARQWIVTENMNPPAENLPPNRDIYYQGQKGSPIPADNSFFTGELRVAAIGSAFPIPYAATVCPYSKIPQPAMNQLDRDGDGLTDDWELKYGFDKHNKADAQRDFDGDGFTNLEEFRAATNPDNPEIHPPYVEKLRFVERKDVPFPLVFQGVTELSDGSMVFQLNTPADGLTHFIALGERVEGVLLQRFIPSESGSIERLIVERDGVKVELIRGEISADPKSKAELINILDRSPIIATMGALLSLRNDDYTVLSVHRDKVVVKQAESGKVFDIISLADEE